MVPSEGLDLFVCLVHVLGVLRCIAIWLQFRILMILVNDVTFQLRCVSGNNMSELWLHVSQSALMWIIGLMYVALCFICGFGLKVGVITWV